VTSQRDTGGCPTEQLAPKQTSCDFAGNDVPRRPKGRIGKVSIALSCGCLTMAGNPADERQADAAGRTNVRIGAPQIMKPDIRDASGAANAAPLRVEAIEMPLCEQAPMEGPSQHREINGLARLSAP
jgi:hypothetical protein